MITAIRELLGSKRNVILATIVFAYLLWLVVYNTIVAKNDQMHFLIEEHVTGGLSVHKDPGNFFKWFNSIHRWEWANAIWFSEYDNEGSGNDESIGIRYLDGALGNISGIMIYAFDYNTPDSVLKALQGDLKNQDNFEDRIIRQKLFDVVPLAAALMTSDESYTTRKKEFGFMALDQLQDGKYKTYVKRDTVIDFTGEKLVTDAQKVLTEKKTVTINGKKDIIETPLRVEDKTLREMNVSIPVFSLYEPSYVKDVAERIEKKRSEAMKKVVSIAKTKLENRENYLETVKGKVEIIKKKYEQMAINKKQILAAQTTLDTVRVISETNRDVMRIKKVIAGMKKNIEELKGTKEYRVRQLKVYADNQLEAYLGAYKEAQLTKASAFKNAKQIMPTTLLGSNNSHTSSGQNQTAWDMMLLNQAKQLVTNKEK